MTNIILKPNNTMKQAPRGINYFISKMTKFSVCLNRPDMERCLVRLTGRSSSPTTDLRPQAGHPRAALETQPVLKDHSQKVDSEIM